MICLPAHPVFNANQITMYLICKTCQHCFFLPERHLRFVFYKYVGYKFTGCIINIFSYSSHVIKSGIATTTFVFMSLALLD